MLSACAALGVPTTQWWKDSSTDYQAKPWVSKPSELQPGETPTATQERDYQYWEVTSCPHTHPKPTTHTRAPPTPAPHLHPSLSPRTQARTQEGDLGASGGKPAHHADFKNKYDPAHYMSDTCEAWCAGEVFINVAKATAKGRKKFPPTLPGKPGPIASEEEKCSWDNMCSGCDFCAESTPPRRCLVLRPSDPPSTHRRSIGE